MNIDDFVNLSADQKTHHFWHNGETTDVTPMRNDATRRANDKRWPENSIIHHHPSGEPCDLLKHKHEVYKVNQGLVE